jgi:hypothetical protein
MNLDLRRTKEHLALSSEHCAAPASPPVHLELVTTSAETTHREVVAQLRAEWRRSLEEQVLDLFSLREPTLFIRIDRRSWIRIEEADGLIAPPSGC